jgi:hypothetical protein
MAQADTTKLVFHFETDSTEVDMAALQKAIDAELTNADGVQSVSTEVLGTNRFVDPITVGAMIVTVTFAVKETTALVDALDGLVESVKKLGVSLGVTAWLEDRRKRVELDEHADGRTVAETVATNVRASAQPTQ